MKFVLEVENSPSTNAWFVTSKDFPGLLVSKMTLEEALSDVPRAVGELELAGRLSDNPPPKTSL